MTEEVCRDSFSISTRELVRELNSQETTSKIRNKALPFVVGRKPDGEVVTEDLVKQRHLLVGGTAGKGDADSFLSMLLTGFAAVLSPEDVRFVLVTSSLGAFLGQDRESYLLMPIVKDCGSAVFALRWAVCEMEKRLLMFLQASVRNVRDYNSRTLFEQDDLPRTMPSVVIVLADVGEMLDDAGDETTTDITRLIAKGHAVGIHLVASAERVPANGVASVLANFPARIAFRTKTAQDANGIVGDVDAAAFPGGGDCLYRDKDNVILRLQAPKMMVTNDDK